MRALLPAILLVAFACRSADDDASEVALAYLSVPVDGQVKAWPLLCPADQQVRPLEQLRPDDAPLQLLPESAVRVKRAEEELAFSVKSVTLDPTGSKGVVEVDARGEFGSYELRVDVEKQDERWCVPMGWAEARREREEIAAFRDEFRAELEAARELYDDWKLAEARERLDQMAKRLDALPEDHAGAQSVRSDLALLRAEVDRDRDRWLGGRWTGETSPDPLTDHFNATAVLYSTEGISMASRANARNTSLTLSCQRGVLDVQLRSLGIYGVDPMIRHRFGAAEPEVVQAAEVERYTRTLPHPRTWLHRLAQHDGEPWRVELPVGRTGATATFDLTGAREAVDLITRACPAPVAD